MADTLVQPENRAQGEPSQTERANPARKRVVLHMGMGKTGTSALQSAFARNRDQLAKMGVVYPPHASDAAAISGRTVSGNGLDLARVLRSPSDGDDAAAAFLHTLRETVEQADQRTILFSSEFMYRYRLRRLRQLRRTLVPAGIDLQAVVYVRDVAGHALSSYSQQVKRQLYTGSFTDYLTHERAYRPGMPRRLDRLRRTLGDQNVTVLHYDSARKRILDHFLQHVFGVSTVDGFDLAAEHINRSLTRHEIQMMRYVNASLSAREHSRRISDVFTDLPPLGAVGHVITQAEVDVLTKRFAEDVAWVNDQFFSDAPLQIVGSGVTVVEEAEAMESLSATERHLLDSIIELVKPRALDREAAAGDGDDHDDDAGQSPDGEPS